MLSLTGVDHDNSRARRATHPAFDANTVGQWFPSTGQAVACSMAARSLVVNIPIDLLCYREVCGSAERNADSLIGRILSIHDDESGAPHPKYEQALAIAALINLLVDREHVGNGRPSNPYQEAVHREKHICPKVDTKEDFFLLHESDCYEPLRSFFFCLELLQSPPRGEDRENAVIGLRFTKFILSPHYSEGLSWAFQIAHASDVVSTSQTGKSPAAKRAREEVNEAAQKPLSAHSRVCENQSLLDTYKQYSGDSGRPLVFDWNSLFAQAKGSPFAYRPWHDSEKQLHVLSPSYVLDPRVNSRALVAGLRCTPLVERGPHHVEPEDNPTPTIAPPPLTWHARRSKADKSDDDEDQKNPTETSCWVMFTGCPSTSRLPPEVSSLINKAVVAARVRGVVDAD